MLRGYIQGMWPFCTKLINMNLQEIKNYIALWYADQGYDEYEVTDKIIENTLKEAEVIYTEKDSSSRWYENVFNVVKLGNKYFKYEDI